MNNFFVVGLPRSRTAWLANFLTYDNRFCYHEGIDGCSTIEEYKKKLGTNKGDSCTGLMLLELNKEFPNAPVVIIENNITKAVKFSRQTYGIETTKEMQILKEKMSFIRGLRIKLENINEALEDIWVHLIGTPYNEERGNLLKNMNIQTNNYFNYDEKAAKTLLMGMQ